MPKTPVPAIVDAFLRQPNYAVMGVVAADGGPHTTATWYLWEGGRVLVNMGASRRRLDYLRRDGRVSLTAVSVEGWHRHVSVLGTLDTLRLDEDHADIDRLARHYTGHPFGDTAQERWSASFRIERWHGWEGSGPWPRPEDLAS